MTNRQAAIRIVRRLRKAGYQALLAGGCVRDRLLGRRPNDYDVVTDAPPDAVIRLFRRTLKVGAQFGVVIVLQGSQQVEVATFRSEAEYTDGRRPDHVTFCDARHDALRRDFTVNGMFYDPIERRVIDYVGGRDDLQRGILRTIGPPDERFGEDYLRMLRAVRFAVQLGFEIEPATWQGIRRHAERITRVSGERIAVELEAVLTHPDRARGVRLLVESHLARHIFRDFDGRLARAACGLYEHLPRSVDFALALAALFADVPTEWALERCAVLKPSRRLLQHVQFLLDHRECLLDAEMSLARLKMFVASPYYHDLFVLHKAMREAEARSLAPLRKIRRRAAQLAGKDITPRPLLNGHELQALGVQPGPQVGQVAQEMYVAQLDEKIHTPDEARQWVRQWLARHAPRD